MNRMASFTVLMMPEEFWKVVTTPEAYSPPIVNSSLLLFASPWLVVYKEHKYTTSFKNTQKDIFELAENGSLDIGK